MQEVTLRRPDDWHVHLRDGSVLEAVLPYTARQFARAIIMPNLSTPVTTPSQAASYRRRILQALPEDARTARFMPLMTAYLTDEIQVGDLVEGFQDGVFHAAKLYPANATTNSSQGVTDIKKLAPVFRKMQEIGMPLLIHGEVTNPDVDIFDREAIFIRDVLKPLINEFSGLKVVLEHITTQQSVDFIRSMEGRVGATITAHHLIINRNAMFQGGLRPHHYCLPVAKREEHRLALRKAATSGHPAFFLVPIRHPTPWVQKKWTADAPGSSQPSRPLSFMPRYSRKRTLSISWRDLHPCMGPHFMALRRMRAW